MSRPAALEDALIQKIRSLPQEKTAEVEDLVDREVSRAIGKLAENVLRRAWENPSGGL